MGRQHLDLRQLPRGLEVLDVMGNDPRHEGAALWEVGMQPLFVVSAQRAAPDLAAAVRGTVRASGAR